MHKPARLIRCCRDFELKQFELTKTTTKNGRGWVGGTDSTDTEKAGSGWGGGGGGFQCNADLIILVPNLNLVRRSFPSTWHD